MATRAFGDDETGDAAEMSALLAELEQALTAERVAQRHLVDRVQAVEREGERQRRCLAA